MDKAFTAARDARIDENLPGPWFTKITSSFFKFILFLSKKLNNSATNSSKLE